MSNFPIGSGDATVKGLDVRADASLRAAATDPTARPAGTPEQVRALAVQFESILLSQMLKDLRDSMFDSDDESSGFSAGPLGDTMFQEFSLALSRAGGIGLAESLVKPLEAAAGVAAAGPTFVTSSTETVVHQALNAPAALDRP